MDIFDKMEIVNSLVVSLILFFGGLYLIHYSLVAGEIYHALGLGAFCCSFITIIPALLYLRRMINVDKKSVR